MGADVVIAVDLGSSGDTSDARYARNGPVASAVKRMNARRSRTSASFVIAPALAPFGSLDWRKAAALAVSGYNAAQDMSADLLPLAVDDATWKKYLAKRAAKRRSRMPSVVRLDIRGATAADTRSLRARLQWQLKQPLNPVRVEKELLRLGDLDRYVSLGWDLLVENGSYVLVVKALRDSRSTPLLMSAVDTSTRPSVGTSFQTRPLVADQYVSGLPWKLDGFSVGERRGSIAVLTIPYLRAIGRPPTSLAGHVGKIAES